MKIFPLVLISIYILQGAETRPSNSDSMIIIDNAGYQFIDSANESELFQSSRTKIKFFDFNSDKEGVDYQKMLLAAKRQYNKKENAQKGPIQLKKTHKNIFS